MITLRRITVFVLWVITVSCAYSQTTDSIYSQSYLDKSTRFAWTTFGADLLRLSGGTTDYLDGSGNLQSTDWSGSVSPRLTMGGIHFYGHADFYVTFPLNWITIGREPDEFTQFVHESGIETGIRIYPIALQRNAIRPYVGISFRSLTFGFEPQNSGFTRAFPLFERFLYPIQAGITYTTKRYLISFGTHYQTRKNIRYALSETQMGDVSFDPLSFQFSILNILTQMLGPELRPEFEN